MEKLLLLILALASVSAQADMFKPSASCSKPSKPYEFTSQWQLDSFKRDIEAYERCIDRFVAEQREAAKTHAEAANDAVRDYNSFAGSLR